MKALIFGASSDIGVAICSKYLKSGWSVIGVYRSHCNQLDHLENLYPENFKCIQFELTDSKSLKDHLQERVRCYSTCDSVINCIGLANPKEYEDITEEDIIKHFQINTIPNIVFNQFFSKFMIKRGWGRFVYISSIGIKYSGGIENYCYSMSKLLTEFFPAVAKNKWALKNVFINAVRAGYIDTKFHSKFSYKDPAQRISSIPIGRSGKAHEVAEAVFFLGSELNSFITCEVLTVSGGE